MGSMQANEYAALAKEGSVDLKQALAAHLQSNHYPPIPSDWIQPAINAIEAANAGNWEDAQIITTTCERSGMTPRQAYVDGRHTWIKAGELIEVLHLDAFLDVSDEEG